MRTWRWYSKVVLALLLAAFAYFVWPTRYAWEVPSTGGFPTVIRRDRFTGQILLLRPPLVEKQATADEMLDAALGRTGLDPELYEAIHGLGPDAARRQRADDAGRPNLFDNLE